jgi:5-methylcytosine-specific restriction endonuclease McrA
MTEGSIAPLLRNRPTTLRNAACVYCGTPFGQEPKPTIEHVVGL